VTLVRHRFLTTRNTLCLIIAYRANFGNRYSIYNKHYFKLRTLHTKNISPILSLSNP
jgi:hypothetical protein